MKLGKYTLGKNTATIDTGRDWAGERYVSTIAYRHISSVNLHEYIGDSCLTIQMGGQCLQFDGDRKEAPKLREFAAELHQRMEQCQ